ncbi:MAG: hypothetical protein ACR2H5_23880 [Ktedonobacteraceae bacterium]
MIIPDAKLSIKRLSLSDIVVVEYQERYSARLSHYISLLQQHPGEYAGLLAVAPSKTHPGMYTLLDGHHRFVASIMTGRRDALCVVIEA